MLQYLPLLRRQGIEPHVARPVPEPIYERLMERGARSQANKLAYYALFLACRLRDVQRAPSADVVVIQRDLFPFGPPLLERALWRRNPHLVYDTDDATYLRPSFTPTTTFQRWRRFDKVAEVVRHARWVSAATDPIADWARRLSRHVSVVPMAVDLAAYDAAAAQQGPRAPGQPIVLGWAGTAGGLGYLEALAPALRRLAQQHDVVVRVISGGYRQVHLPGVPLEAVPWRAETALADLASFDIGLVPLDDTPFERAKFPFKLLQYLALGIPAVAARVGLAARVIQHADNGALAGSHEEWLAALSWLVRDAPARVRLAQAGRQTVAERYTIERVGPQLAAGLLAAAR